VIVRSRHAPDRRRALVTRSVLTQCYQTLKTR
jgi:hypothetical protein